MPLGKFLSQLTAKPGSWSTNPWYGFLHTEKKASRISEEANDQYEEAVLYEQQTYQLALLADSTARQSGYSNSLYNEQAKKDIANWLSAKEKLSSLQKNIRRRHSTNGPGS